MTEFHFHCLPAEATNITQLFGENPEDYIPYGLPYHLGVDFGLWVGDPVYNVAPGKATLCDRDPNNKSGFGIYCIIQHDEHYRTIYAHLDFLIIKAGQDLEECQHIGGAGSTGRSDGPHLHLQLENDGLAIDPMPFLLPLLGDEPPPSPPGFTFGFVFAPSTICSEGYAGQYGLNLRLQPKTSGHLLGYLPPETRFQILGKVSGAYYPVYVAKELIEEKP